MVVDHENIHVMCVVTNTENSKKKDTEYSMNVMNMIIKYNLLII